MNARDPDSGWKRIVSRRRCLLSALVSVPAVTASYHLARMLPEKGGNFLEAAVVILFGLLFTWISIGFWLSVVGLVQLWRRYDRFSIPESADAPVRLEKTRTAVIMPIYNEDVEKVCRGIEVMYRSLSRTGRLATFDFYILSDTRDPDIWVAEEVAWADLCARLDAFSRIHYRHRRPNIKRKSGNIADFCRRWGYRYEFMIVLDADSLMTGDAMVRMVGAMLRHPRIGILQSVPAAFNRETLFGRMLQFANHVYGPMLAAGLYYVQFGDAQFWGHNAIIRVAPFMRYCGLPKLPGDPPLGGEIMSHDFVESALMRRAGWQVWMSYDFTGSYEETPPTLIDELQRDRRWCQGNLQHLKLLFVKGLVPTHRALFLKGIFSYGASLLWAAYLFISTLLALWQKIGRPNYFPETHSLFPVWPVWQWEWAFVLTSSAFIILFLPRFLALIWIWAGQKEAARYGGAFKLFLGVLFESVLSTLLAPIRMLFHSKFVLLILLGRSIGWNAQSREDCGTRWGDALSAHALGVGISLVSGVVVGLINPPFLLWLSPILVALALSPVISVITSRASAGRVLKRWGLLLIPEEIDPPRELRHLKALASAADSSAPECVFEDQPGFIRAVVDPLVNDLHIALLDKKRSLRSDIARRRRQLQRSALEKGPDALSPTEKLSLLSDPVCLATLHRRVWELPRSAAARAWGLA